MNLVLNYESSALAAPQSFRDAMQTAANILDVEILDNITVTILVGYGDWNNGAFTTKKGQALGGSLDDLFVNYSDLRSALAAHETSVLDQSVVNSLPNTSTIDNHYAFGVSSAVAKALGLMSPTASVIDGAVGFDPSIPTNLLVGAALHELTHAMGREPSSGVSGSGAAIAAGTFDFVRYTSAGNHLYSTDGTAVPAYFSIDGGNTKLADFGQTSDSSDFLNSGVQGPNDPFNEFGNSKTIQSLTAVDREVLDAIGFNTTPAILQTDGSTSLAQGGNHYLLISGSTESGLMYSGAPVTAGQFGSISPIGAVQTANGYDIAWKVPGNNEFTFWSTDINGNYTSNLSGLVSGNSFAVEQFETVFGQDLNGDGTVGVTSSLIQTAGSTSLLAIADNYYIYTHGSGPELNYGGAPVVAGEFGNINPIGAIATSNGYEIVWQIPGTTEFTFWTVDTNGNYVGNITGLVHGTAFLVESAEAAFGRDLNGDGSTGVTSSVIQTDVATSLLAIADNYYMYINGSGPELKYSGAPVVVGEFGSIAPVGAIQTANGYDIAWKIPGTNEFTFWSTDSNGNYTGNLTDLVSGTSAVAEQFETIFHQDLNGDGVIGVPSSSSVASSATFTPVSGSSADVTLKGTNPPVTPSALSAVIVGNGTAGADQIELRGLDFSKAHSTFDNSSGTLSVTDGLTTASLHVLGLYSQDSFHFASDGNGGTLIAVAPSPGPTGAASQVADSTAHDTFVFAPNFGQVILANFAPATDTLQFSKTVFSDVTALLAATHDDALGNAVMTDAAHDTITLQHVTTAQLFAHQSDFYFA